MANQQKKMVVTDVVPNPVITNVSEEQLEQKYVVTRGGHRVSDREYSFSEDPVALLEKQFWQKIVNRHPDGTKIEVVPFNKKLHRIW